MSQPVSNVKICYELALEEAALDIEEWRCPVCFGNDPNEDTLVAHEEGEQHPLHKACLLSWIEQRSICPACNAEIDASDLVSLSEKCKIMGMRAINQYAKPTWKCLTGALGEVTSGVPLFAAGQISHNPLLSVAGLGLQAHGINRALQEGREVIAASDEISQLVSEILENFETLSWEEGKGKIELLKWKISSHRSYYSDLPEIATLLDSENSDEIWKGLDKVREIAQQDWFSHRLLEAWKYAAGAGALYFFLSRR